MKFLKSLFGQEPEPAATPTWDIKPQDAGVAPPRRKQADTGPEKYPTAKPEPEANPFLDDPMLDTMSLEVDDLEMPDENPYRTSTWEMDPDNDTRRMRTIQVGDKEEKKPGTDFNPYDTGKMRKGWKQ